MNAIIREFAAAAKQGPRLFFAPWIGAIRAVGEEVRRLTVTEKDSASDRRGPVSH
jgi:hypothetical protein